MSVGNDTSKPDSTSCDTEDVKREKMDVDSEKGGDSASQCTSSSGAKEVLADERDDSVFSREAGEAIDSVDMGGRSDAKSPSGSGENGGNGASSSHELRHDADGCADEDMDAEENVENTTPGHKRSRGRPPKAAHERKRRPRAKDHNAPKAPINGYVRFLNENRERCRRDNPDIAFASITKLLALEWSALKPDEKQKYLDAAERDRERYVKEVEEYQRTDAYRQFRQQLADEEAANRQQQHCHQQQQQQQQQQQHQHQQQPHHHMVEGQAAAAREVEQHRRRQQLKANNNNSNNGALSSSGSAGAAAMHANNGADSKFGYKMGGPVNLKPKGVAKSADDALCRVGAALGMGGRDLSPPAPMSNVRHNPEDSTFDIPIFTEEFLDHNKAREAEMRALRKSHTELEQHNAVLAKHIDSFKDAIGRLEAEAETHRNSNKAMEVYLARLRSTLAEAFKQVVVPGWEAGAPTVENVDAFLEHAFGLIQSAPREYDKLLHNIRGVVAGIEGTLRDL